MTTHRLYDTVPPEPSACIAIPATLLDQARTFLGRYGSWDPEAAHLAASFDAILMAPKLSHETELDPV
jgi:hypothetical protein